MVKAKVKHLVVDSGAFIKNAPVHVSYVCFYYSKILISHVKLFCLYEWVRVIEVFLISYWVHSMYLFLFIICTVY